MANTYFTLQSGLMFHLFENVQHSKPTGLAIGLTTSAPTNRAVIEIPNQSGYARVASALGSAAWSYQADGKVYNNNVITFNVASGYWGWTSGVFISDSSAYGGGNILFFNSHMVPKELNTNDQVSYPVSGLFINLT